MVATTVEVVASSTETDMPAIPPKPAADTVPWSLGRRWSTTLLVTIAPAAIETVVADAGVIPPPE